MSEMIERVAKALYDISLRKMNSAEWEDAGSFTQDTKRREARAAIEAMREPTRDMIDAAATVDRYAEPGEEWGPMIDTALREKVDA